MTTFASVALFSRDGRMTFRPPRKEASDTVTQARKSAARHWNNAIKLPDKIGKVILVSHRRGTSIIDLSERDMRKPRSAWIDYSLEIVDAIRQANIQACMIELGITPDTAPPPLPDILTINGAIYRREI